MTLRKLLAPAAFLAAAGLVVGCGPMDKPMPPRLAPDQQKEIDAAWDAALAPVGKHSRQEWLDALLATQAYQAGVDVLTFRSEKAFAGGKVVMEVFFDRTKPAADRFVVTVFDKAGATVRQEKYTRADVELASKELQEVNKAGPPQPGDPPAVAKKKADAAARLKGVEKMLPRANEPK